MCMFVSLYVHINVSACGGQKRVSDLLELEFQVIVKSQTWMLGIKL